MAIGGTSPHSYQFVGWTDLWRYPFPQASGETSIIALNAICSTGISLDTAASMKASLAREHAQDPTDEGRAVRVDTGPFYDGNTLFIATAPCVNWGQVFDRTLADSDNRPTFETDIMSAVESGDRLTMVLNSIALPGAMKLSLDHPYRGHIGTLPDDAESV